MSNKLEFSEFNAAIEDEYIFDANPPPGTEVLGALDIQRDYGSGSFAEDGRLEIGSVADEETEAGAMKPYGAIMTQDYTLEAGPASSGPTEIGGPYALDGASEIGAEKAVLKVVEKARDNRQPPPPMRAVDPDAPDLDWSGMDVYVGCAIGAAKGAAKDPFPLTTSLMLRASASGEPRFVRIDTPESYKAFRVENSPEMSELSARVAELHDKFEEHIVDPAAHSALVDEIDEVVALGAAVEAEQAAKRVQLWMPKRYEGQIEAWMEGGNVCVSMALPSLDGDVRICTSLEPIRRCVSEMSRHAADAGVPASSIVGVLPAMGCVLGAGTVIKEVAAAAPEILRHPSASGRLPFMLRIEPKVSPTLAAMAHLAYLCKQDNKQACDEWARLSAAAPAPLKRAMQEAIVAIKAA